MSNGGFERPRRCSRRCRSVVWQRARREGCAMRCARLRGCEQHRRPRALNVGKLPDGRDVPEKAMRIALAVHPHKPAIRPALTLLVSPRLSRYPHIYKDRPPPTTTYLLLLPPTPACLSPTPLPRVVVRVDKQVSLFLRIFWRGRLEKRVVRIRRASARSWRQRRSLVAVRLR